MAATHTVGAWVWREFEGKRFAFMSTFAKEPPRLLGTRRKFAQHGSGGAWVSPRVEIWSEGKLVFFEDYDDLRVNVELDDALFQPKLWKTARHWTSIS